MPQPNNRTDLFFKYRGLLVTPPLALSLFWPISQTAIDHLIWPVGLTIFLIAVFGRIWAQQHLHFRLKRSVTFTDTGPYSFVRNPIYIFNTLGCVGLTVVSHTLWMVPITLFWCVMIYHFVVRDEERSLVQYGEAYEAYRKRVNRWLPARFDRPPVFVNEFLAASIRAELYNAFFLIPFVIKELLFHAGR